MEKVIKSPIRLDGTLYRKGNEAALQRAAAPAQIQDWQQAGLIEGEWGGETSSALTLHTLESSAAVENLARERDDALARVQVLEVQNQAAQDAAEAGHDAVNAAMQELQKAQQERDAALARAQVLEGEAKAAANNQAATEQKRDEAQKKATDAESRAKKLTAERDEARKQAAEAAKQSTPKAAAGDEAQAQSAAST